MRLRGSKLLASCTCPYFNPQGEPCKHLWATLLLAEARGLLHSPPVFPVHLIAENLRETSHDGLPGTRTSSALERQSLELGELGLEMMGLVPSRPAGPIPEEPRLIARASRFTTTRHISKAVGVNELARWGSIALVPENRSKIKIPAAGFNAGSARPRAINRNSKRLLVYILDVSATPAQNQVVIDLARRQRKTTGEWGPLRPWYYAPHAAHVKYDPEDRLLSRYSMKLQGSTLPRWVYIGWF